MNRLFLVFILGIISICLFLSCEITDLPEGIETQRNPYWYSFMDNNFEPMPKNPAVLNSETKNEILGVYLTETNKKFGWELTIDDVWVEKYYGIYNDCVAVLLNNKYLVPEEGGYINDELEIVIDTVSFLFGPITSSTIVIYKDGKLYDLQEASDKRLLTRGDLKNIAYYQNEGFIPPQRTHKKPSENKIIWEGDISQDFDDKTMIIITDKNYTSWRLFAGDFTGVDVIQVQSLIVQRLSKYPNYDHGDIICIEIGNPGKQNVADAIRELEKLDFIKYAGPNYIYYLER